MHNPSKPITLAWLFKMAWRDSRKNRSRLLLFISSIVLGIAALVAVYSFKDNLQRDIDNQAKELTGADIVIQTRKLDENLSAKLVSFGDEYAFESSFASMVYFIKNEGSRLVQIKSLHGNYPFYGEIETVPVNAGRTFQQGKNALVDKTLMLQFNAKVGDSIQVGKLNFNISGVLEKAPGQTGISTTIAPIVYIPDEYIGKTDLLKAGSRVTFKYFYKINNADSLAKTVKVLEPIAKKEGFDVETVESKKEDTGRSFRDMSRFMALSGFIALLLGCIGVGSAIHVYIQEKLGAIATLRCLGLKARHTFLIYLIQISVIGIIGATIGAILGTLVQFLLPIVLEDFLPVTITMQVSWSAIGQGIALGLVISILFALPSLLAVRRISPLNAIRASFENSQTKTDPLRWFVYLLMFLFVLGFTYLQMQSWVQTVAFTIGILIAFLLLAGCSKLLMYMVRKLIPASLSYLWRQGFANLYRPNNQTLMLTVAIGLSTAFISTLFFVQGILMNRVTLSSSENQPNMVLFDIQTVQKPKLNELTKGFKLPVMN
ncbi:MAG: FtsX-like permease family protein, partial [Flavobacterium sp.]